MLKWKKVDKDGNPARRNCNSYEEHDYVSTYGKLSFKIINDSFGYDPLPWMFTCISSSGAEFRPVKFKRLKDAKAHAEATALNFKNY